MLLDSKLKTVHLTGPGYCKVFVCGRPVGSFHKQVDEDPRFDSPICWACFNKASGDCLVFHSLPMPVHVFVQAVLFSCCHV